MRKYSVPRVATVAINVKGADLLYLDHTDSSELEERDYKMWKAAGVSVDKPPFGRVLIFQVIARLASLRSGFKISGRTLTCSLINVRRE